MIFSHKVLWLARQVKPMAHVTYKVVRHEDARPTPSTARSRHACIGARSRAPRRRRGASAGAERDRRIRGRARQWQTELALGSDRLETDVEDST
jgi:hypothetical protein